MMKKSTVVKLQKITFKKTEIPLVPEVTEIKRKLLLQIFEVFFQIKIIEKKTRKIVKNNVNVINK